MMKYSDAYWQDVRRVLPHIRDREKLFGKSVLMTGGTGLICSGVVDILHYLNREENAGIEILLAGRGEERIARRFYHMAPCREYRFVRYDAAVPGDLDVRADFMIHGAGYANPAAFVSRPVETMEANITGLNTLLKLAAKNSGSRVLFLSSSEVYGQKSGMEPYSEEDYGFLDILNFRACYPSSKRAAETLCIAYSVEYGVDTVIARPGHIYGPAITSGDDRATAQFTRNAVHGEDIVMKSAGSQLRSYCYFLDCASAILAILLNGEKGNAYNISNPNSVVTIRGMAEAIAGAAGKKLVFANSTDAEKRSYSQMTNASLDSGKLEALGWNGEFSLDEGADRCIRFYGEEKRVV